MSISLEEVDTANFVNALKHGYDIPFLRPHPPGYPVYIFLANVVDGIVHVPLLTLTLLSAVLGSLAVIPFYSLLREFTDPRIVIVGALLFIVNPLIWNDGPSGRTKSAKSRPIGCDEGRAECPGPDMTGLTATRGARAAVEADLQPSFAQCTHDCDFRLRR